MWFLGFLLISSAYANTSACFGPLGDLPTAGKSVEVIHARPFEVLPKKHVGRILVRVPTENKVANSEGGLMDWPGNTSTTNVTRLQAAAKRFPGFTQTFHFVVSIHDGKPAEEYLDIAAVNALILEMRARGDSFAPSMLFEPVGVRLLGLDYLRLRARRLAPYTADGSVHQHDYAGIHGMTEILLPEEMVSFIAESANRVVQAYDNPALMALPEFRTLIESLIPPIVDAIDINSGDLGVRILGRFHLNGKMFTDLPISDPRVVTAIEKQLESIVVDVNQSLGKLSTFVPLHGQKQVSDFDFQKLARQMINHLHRQRPLWLP